MQGRNKKQIESNYKILAWSYAGLIIIITILLLI
jgi:hypothetical protein